METPRPTLPIRKIAPTEIKMITSEDTQTVILNSFTDSYACAPDEGTLFFRKEANKNK